MEQDAPNSMSSAKTYKTLTNSTMASNSSLPRANTPIAESKIGTVGVPCFERLASAWRGEALKACPKPLASRPWRAPWRVALAPA